MLNTLCGDWRFFLDGSNLELCILGVEGISCCVSLNAVSDSAPAGGVHSCTSVVVPAKHADATCLVCALFGASVVLLFPATHLSQVCCGSWMLCVEVEHSYYQQLAWVGGDVHMAGRGCYACSM